MAGRRHSGEENMKSKAILTRRDRRAEKIFFFNRTYRLFSEYSALLQNLEKYCYYEIKIHRRCVTLLLKRVIVG